MPTSIVKPLILVAESDPVALETFKQLFEKKGYRVYPALGYIQTLMALPRLTGSDKPSLAVISLHLGKYHDTHNKDGLIAAREAQRLGIPILMIFEAADKATRLEVLGGQQPLAIAFLNKADGPQPLLVEVKRALANQHSTRSPVG